MCDDCGRENRRGGRYCSRCYMHRYFQASPVAYAKHKARVGAHAKAHRAQRLRWVHAYRQRIGWHNPDLTALRRSLKRLEQAVAQAARRQELRGPGE